MESKWLEPMKKMHTEKMEMFGQLLDILKQQK